MTIYGVAIISGCMFVGNLIGDILGELMMVNSNVGGVGFSMIFLILMTDSSLFGSKLSKSAIDGLKYWQNMYIPVVAAMTASQNVVQAMSGGVVAVVAGFLATTVCFLLLPLFNIKLFKSYLDQQESEIIAE
ncbi:MAG: malonate transporter subunit MadL [Tepidanaerobacteraceae bacterium]